MTGFNSKRKAAADKLQEPVCDKDPQGCWNVRCQLGKQCKNLAQPAQEPAAWAVVGDGKFGKYEIGRETLTDIDSANYWISRGYKLVSIYTAPPQRPWVGLTDEEIHGTFGYNETRETYQFALALIAKLKERNS